MSGFKGKTDLTGQAVLDKSTEVIAKAGFRCQCHGRCGRHIDRCRCVDGYAKCPIPAALVDKLQVWCFDRKYVAWCPTCALAMGFTEDDAIA